MRQMDPSKSRRATQPLQSQHLQSQQQRKLSTSRRRPGCEWLCQAIKQRISQTCFILSNTGSFSDLRLFAADQCTARSREDETRNGHRNTKRNPRWPSQGSFANGLFEKRTQLSPSKILFLYSDDHFESHLPGNGL